MPSRALTPHALWLRECRKARLTASAGLVHPGPNNRAQDRQGARRRCAVDSAKGCASVHSHEPALNLRRRGRVSGR